jgi:hypothetical protein
VIGFLYRHFGLTVLATAFLAASSSDAKADPLTTFTLTDLGAGTPVIESGSNGGVVIAGNGQTAYPFLVSQGLSVSYQQLSSSHMPLIAQAPISNPDADWNPLNVYSMPLNTITDGNGTYVAIDAYGVNGHMGQAEVYSVRQNSDGTWGTPIALWSGGEQFSGSASAAQASLTGINKLGEVLGVGADGFLGSGSGVPQTYLYNLNTQSLLNLGTLAVLTSGGWNNLRPIAIDNQGRILLEGPPNPAAGDPLAHPHGLLLTPEGVSSTPLMVPTPEPGALALAAVTLAALALRKAVRARA